MVVYNPDKHENKSTIQKASMLVDVTHLRAWHY